MGFAEIDALERAFASNNQDARMLRFSLATGLHVLAAHERRHLWQAWRVRRAVEAGEHASRPMADRIS